MSFKPIYTVHFLTLLSLNYSVPSEYLDIVGDTMGVSSYFGSCTDTEGSKSLHLESLEKLSGLAGNFSASTTGTLPIMRFFRDYFNSAFEPALEPALERLPLPSSFFGSSTLNPSMTEFTIHVHTVDILP